jgi:hypothetical protein
MAFRSVLLTSFFAILATARPQATSTENSVAIPTPLSDPLYGLVTVNCGCWNECTLMQKSPETAILNADCPANCGNPDLIPLGFNTLGYS